MSRPDQLPHADLLIDRIGDLVTLAGGPGPRRGAAMRELGLVAGGAVAVADGTIVAAGPAAEVKRAVRVTDETRVIDAQGACVTPGLVDPHTHLVFGGSREHEFELRLQGATYAEIMAAGGGIASTTERTREASLEALVAQGRKHLDAMRRCGTTTLEAKSGYGLDLETELRQLEAIRRLAGEGPLEIVATYMGAHAVPRGADPESYLDLVCGSGLPEVARRGLARYCDVFCEEGVFTPAQTERVFTAAQALGFKLRLHADELSDLGGGALAARMGAVTADHLLMTSEASIRALAGSGTVAVMLPGTPFFLNMAERAPARALIEAGAIVAIGTDFNPGSCFSESLPMMMTLACLHLKMTPAEALTAVTINAAHAIEASDRLGSIEAGKQADLVVWDVPNYRHLSYHFGVPLTRAVIKRGAVLPA